MSNWVDWPEHEGYWWRRKKNGLPKLVRVYAESNGGVEYWYCPSVKRGRQDDAIDGINWQEVKHWDK